MLFQLDYGVTIARKTQHLVSLSDVITVECWFRLSTIHDYVETIHEEPSSPDPVYQEVEDTLVSAHTTIVDMTKNNSYMVVKNDQPLGLDINIEMTKNDSYTRVSKKRETNIY